MIKLKKILQNILGIALIVLALILILVYLYQVVFTKFT
jgi:hypothetical protein